MFGRARESRRGRRGVALRWGSAMVLWVGWFSMLVRVTSLAGKCGLGRRHNGHRPLQMRHTPALNETSPFRGYGHSLPSSLTQPLLPHALLPTAHRTFFPATSIIHSYTPLTTTHPARTGTYLKNPSNRSAPPGPSHLSASCAITARSELSVTVCPSW